MADIRINALATTATTPASDDYLALDGAAQGTRKILATNIANNVTDVILGTSGPSVKSTLSARAPRQGLVFDGTAGATIANVPAFGTGDFTMAAWVNATNLSEYKWLFYGATNSFGLFFNTDGTFACSKVGISDGSNSTGAIAVGKYALVAYVRSGTSGTYYLNGVAAGTTTDSIDYTVATTNVGGTVSHFFVGSASPIAHNRALSAAEVVSLYEAGAPSAGDYNTAGTAIIPAAQATFTSSTNWNLTLLPGSTIDTGAGTLTTTAGSGARYDGSDIYVAKKYRHTVVVTANTGQLQVYDGTTYQNLGASGATGTLVIDLTQAATYSPLIKSNTGAATITDYNCTALGLLLAPDAAQAGNGYVWNDQSGNLAQIVLPSSGVAWNLPSVAGNRIRGTTSTNGNQQLLGASTLLPAECQILYVRARAQSGTPTITIGTASGGAQIVASVALSTTWLNCTIALTGGIVSSADDIWVGSNSTDVVETDIAFQPLDF